MKSTRPAVPLLVMRRDLDPSLVAKRRRFRELIGICRRRTELRSKLIKRPPVEVLTCGVAGLGIGFFPSAARYAPGPSAGSLAGAILPQTSAYLLTPAIGGLVIAGYLAATTAAGLVATSRRDFG